MKILLRHSRAGILHSYKEPNLAMARIPGVKTEGYRPFAGEFHGVPDEIEQDLLQPYRISQERPGEFSHGLKMKCQPFSCSLILLNGQYLPARFRRGKVNRIKNDLPGFDF